MDANLCVASFLGNPNVDVSTMNLANSSLLSTPLEYRCLPSFIVLGVDFAGASELVQFLKHHPKLASPRYAVNFWSGHHTINDAKGDQWRSYLREYPVFSTMEQVNKMYTFEAVPEYFMLDRAHVRRIHEFMPHLKLVLVLIDPVDRFIVWYLQSCVQTDATCSAASLETMIFGNGTE